MKSKGQLDISFAWIFGIIVGAIILILAIYMASRIISTGGEAVDSKTAKEIGILLNPLQLGLEDFKSTKMSFVGETRIESSCYIIGDKLISKYFGEQTIKVSQKSFGEWTKNGGEIKFSNIYVYSNKTIEGTKFNVFAKSFEFPFKVADLIYLIPENKEYCFIDPPDNVKEDVELFNLKNLVLNCTEKSTKICFGVSSACDIEVKYNQGEIITREGKMYFNSDSLMYAGIFSDKFTYECQLKRLMKKTAVLSSLYSNKAILIARAGCDSNLESDLASFKSALDDLKDSANLLNLDRNYAKLIGEKNDRNSECKLW